MLYASFYTPGYNCCYNYGNLGVSYHSLGQFRKAIEFYQRARGITKETRNNELEGKAYGNLGSAHGSLGQFQKEWNSFSWLSSNAKVTGNNESEGTTIGNLVVFISLSGSP